MGMLEDMGARLNGAAIATTGTDLFYGFMPNSPDLCVSLYDAPGGDTDIGQTQGGATLPNFEELMLNVWVRGAENDYPTAHAKIESVWKNLATITNETVNGNRYLRVTKVDGPYTADRDVQSRPILIVRFEVMREV